MTVLDRSSKLEEPRHVGTRSSLRTSRAIVHTPIASGGIPVPRPLVLVVEDELLIRMSAVYMLEEAGFDVVEAGSADEAIALLETNTRIRIVFTDVDLPGSMDGLRLAAAIRDRWPPIELVLTSGHVHVGQEDLPDRGLFLPKPYSAQQLTEAMSSFGHR